MNEFWLLTADHWNECATCKCFAPWPYFHTSQHETRKLRKRWACNVFTPWKAAAVLAQDNSPTTTPTTPSSCWDTTLNSACNAKHGAKQYVYFVNDSKQFYERSSTKLSHSAPCAYANTSRGVMTWPVHNPPPKKVCWRQGNTRAKETWTRSLLSCWCWLKFDPNTSKERDTSTHWLG